MPNGKGKLTPTESEVLDMISSGFHTPREIAIRRGTSRQAVYKTINRLREKGEISQVNHRVDKTQCTSHTTFISNGNQIRLHGQEFNIRIIYKSENYIKKLNQTNLLFIDGNTIRLYKNSIEVYSGNSFMGKDAQEATAKSFKYWQKLFTRIELDLKIIILKHRSENIKHVKSHYAEINNELAKHYEITGDKIKIKAREDNKVWFTIDNSYNLREAETMHPTTAKRDMQEVIAPFFNDLRDNNPPKLSEIMQTISQIVEMNKETAAGLNSIVKLLTPPKLEYNNKSPTEYIG